MAPDIVVESEEIPADLLESIPSVEEPPSEAHALLEAMKRQVEQAFAEEIARVADVFARHMRDLEERLRAADAQLALLASERQRVLEENMEHERRWQQIRSLAGGRA